MQLITVFLATLSAGSSIAVPSMSPISRQTGVNVIDSALNVIGGVRPVIGNEINTINNLLKSTVNNEATPALSSSLTNIANELGALQSQLQPLVNGVLQPLIDAEVGALSTLINDTQSLAQGIETAAKQVLDVLPPAIAKALKQELTAILNALSPAVNPVTTLSWKVIVPTLSESAATLLGQQASSLSTLVNRILSELLADLLKLL